MDTPKFHSSINGDLVLTDAFEFKSFKFKPVYSVLFNICFWFTLIDMSPPVERRGIPTNIKPWLLHPNMSRLFGAFAVCICICVCVYIHTSVSCPACHSWEISQNVGNKVTKKNWKQRKPEIHKLQIHDFLISFMIVKACFSALGIYRSFCLKGGVPARFVSIIPSFDVYVLLLPASPAFFYIDSKVPKLPHLCLPILGSPSTSYGHNFVCLYLCFVWSFRRFYFYGRSNMYGNVLKLHNWQTDDDYYGIWLLLSAEQKLCSLES